MGVQIPHRVPKNWGRSSVGRASHLQCEGRRFNPSRLHQIKLGKGNGTLMKILVTIDKRKVLEMYVMADSDLKKKLFAKILGDYPL